MGLQENMAATIRAIMEKENKSLSDYAGELGISRTALYDYLRCAGNPSTKTIEQIAKKIGISPAALLTGLPDLSHKEVVLLLLDTIDGVAKLPEEKRQRLAELFMEMVKLWDVD